MNTLNNHSLPQGNASLPNYERNDIAAGVLHFGIGNFHRAHQAVYFEELLRHGEKQWGITGVSMRSAATRDALAPQDFLYAQATLSDHPSYRVIGALKNILVAPEDPQAVIDAVANPTTQVITTTVTEKGYYLTGNKVDLTQAEIQAEMSSLASPTTVYGYLAAGIIQRQRSNEPLTVICCDNIQHGGTYLEEGVHLMLERHAPEMLDWVKNHIAFTSSMVDRVVPATSDALKQQVNALGVTDQWPVAGEDFSQWVIEDNFAAQRPPLERVGVQFVESITPYETMKLRFFNAGHSICATLGYLFGDSYVHQAIARPEVLACVEQILRQCVLPTVEAPADMDAELYIAQSIQRFQNSSVPYRVLQVGTDSSQKIQQRWFPTIDLALTAKINTDALAQLLAAWVVYIQEALLANELNDPQREPFAKTLADKQESNADSIVIDFLQTANADGFTFFSNKIFMESIQAYYRAITEGGITQALSAQEVSL